MPFLGWQLGRAWILLTLGIVVFGISDSAYLFRIAEGTYTTGTILDAGWVVGAALMAFAGWQKPARVAVERRSATAWVVFVFPVTFGALAVAVLVYDHFARIHVLALVLAAACLRRRARADDGDLPREPLDDRAQPGRGDDRLAHGARK